MKTLIITSGVEGLLRKTLESLWDEGKYKGDIVVLKYDYFRPRFINLLEKHNVIVKEVTKVYKYFSIEIIRATYEVVKEVYKDYDIIMHLDGNDIRVYGDINPLFEEAKEKIVCVKEQCKNSSWDGYNNYSPIIKSIHWEKFKEADMINAGMYLGPSKLMLKALEWVTKEIDKLQTWGIDQAVFNTYCFNHPEEIKFVGIEWNYLGWYRNYKVIYEGCISNLGGKEFKVNILHLVNIHSAGLPNKPWDREVK